MPACKQCSASFSATPWEVNFYDAIAPVFKGKKYAVPPPALCPGCRQQRRLAFYNRRNLYKRKCDFTGKNMVAIYSPDKPFRVYDRDIWYSDQWDPMQYSRPFDFSRPFVDQFKELLEKVPLISLLLLGENVNSDYNNDDMNLKNCYLVFDGTKGDNCYYGETFLRCENCVDFKFLEDSQLCYECVHCVKCYNLKFSRFCQNSSDSWFLRDCVGCSNCFGCANLNNKKYHIFNEPKSKEEYEAFLKQLNTGHFGELKKMREKAEAFFLTQPCRAVHAMHNENTRGDNLYHCRNAFYCFDSNYLEDCEYLSASQIGARESADIDVWGEGMEYCYECCQTGTNVRNVHFSFAVSEGADNIYYSMYCSRNVHNLFGCIGLRQKQYCILNQQYSKEEYEQLVPRIIEHMQKTGEWGEYFPITASPFGYNETLAQDFYPLTADQAVPKGWKWKEEDKKLPDVTRTIPAERLPDDIKNIPDDVLNWALKCQATGRPYRLTSQELRYYREQKLPVPHFHYEERHRQRMLQRNPHHLWKRHCAKCGQETETSFAPERPEKVYCEACYLKEVH